MNKKIYIATSMYLFESGREFLTKKIIPIIKRKYTISNLSFFETNKKQDSVTKTQIGSPEKIKQIKKQITADKLSALTAANAVFAVLDNINYSDPVAAEIGFACGLGKPVLGYHSIDVNNYPIIEELSTEISWEKRKNQVCYVGVIAKIRGNLENVQAIAYVDKNISFKLAGMIYEDSFLKRVKKGEVKRVRMAEAPSTKLKRAAAISGTFIDSEKVVANGRYELLHYLQALSVSFKYHREGYLGIREKEQRKPLKQYC